MAVDGNKNLKEALESKEKENNSWGLEVLEEE
jgi:hypothetical protein